MSLLTDVLTGCIFPYLKKKEDIQAVYSVCKQWRSAVRKLLHQEPRLIQKLQLGCLEDIHRYPSRRKEIIRNIQGYLQDGIECSVYWKGKIFVSLKYPHLKVVLYTSGKRYLIARLYLMVYEHHVHILVKCRDIQERHWVEHALLRYIKQHCRCSDVEYIYVEGACVSYRKLRYY